MEKVNKGKGKSQAIETGLKTHGEQVDTAGREALEKEWGNPKYWWEIQSVMESVWNLILRPRSWPCLSTPSSFYPGAACSKHHPQGAKQQPLPWSCCRHWFLHLQRALKSPHSFPLWFSPLPLEPPRNALLKWNLDLFIQFDCLITAAAAVI